MTRIVIIDDHVLVRTAFRIMVNSLPGMEVTGEAGNCEEAMALADQGQPDLILLDMYLPDGSGLNLARQLLEKWPDLKIIIVSVGLDHAMLTEAIGFGIHGYITKSATEEELVDAIGEVMSGGVYLGPHAGPAGTDPHRHLPGGIPLHVTEVLTPRQIEVLELIGKGYSTKAISRELGISARTVDVHRSQLAKRLQIRDIAGLVHYAFANGLVKNPA